MKVGQKEIDTQNRVMKFFEEKLGYTNLGNWEEREGNSSIEPEYLEKFLKEKYDDDIIKKAISKIERTINDRGSLYQINKEFYSLLRYGFEIKGDVSEDSVHVNIINWDEPEKNNFYIVEEVTIKAEHTKRPDVVIYVNGIALGVIELKRSTVSVSEGIRQNLDNQKNTFIGKFFSTIQLVMAGNDTEGLRYGVIGTDEKYFLKWKEDLDIENILDKHIFALCQKKRFLEIILNFIVFDNGIKKIARHNQYFGVTKSQEFIKRREGGIIWHTQGSGKSLTMIWLAKWIRENVDDSRILLITDREELDGQIEGFFKNVGENIQKTKSGKDLINRLNKNEDALICSLIHKFRSGRTSAHDDYLEDLLSNIPADFKAKGDLYVFVDECHRTQSGKLHDAMEKLIPNAVTIGFTGTPLLQKDKKTSHEIFGQYIHTYKFDEAVEDKVILPLYWEARDIEQFIRNPSKIDQWFEAKTKNLTENAKTELKKKWGTLQKIRSSKSWLDKVVADIMFDMETKPRLANNKGNAILVAANIPEACKFYELFQDAGLKSCAIVTSYNSHISSTKGETVSTEEETDNLQKYETYQKMLANFYKISKTMKDEEDQENFEKEVKKLFVKEPGQMKLLIVVDKLLTGFDAPPASYLYINKSMRNHGLFQAICRINRLDGEDKEYGLIIDYKDLFTNLENAVTDYTSDAFDGFDPKDTTGLLKDRLEEQKKKLESSLETVKLVCEPVKPTKNQGDYTEYFCGNPEDPEDLKKTMQQRNALYKSVSSLDRAYSAISTDMREAGYSESEIQKIKEDVRHYHKVSGEIAITSGENIDLKAYEPGMRFLYDTCIEAEDSKIISAFENKSIIEIILKDGIENTVDRLPEGIKNSKKAVAETMENNVRKAIVVQQQQNPKFFKKMSDLLDEIIESRKEDSGKYKEHLKRIEELKKILDNPTSGEKYPEKITTKGLVSLYDNLDKNEDVVSKLHSKIKSEVAEGWRGNRMKEKAVKIIIKNTLQESNITDEETIEKIFQIVSNQDEY